MSENTSKYGETTARHDAMDVDQYYARIYESVQKYKGGIIADLFSGGGRDIVELYRKLDGDGQFIAIDSESQKILDMIAKNEALEAEPLFKDITPFELVTSVQGLKDAFNHHSIAVIQGRFPDRPFGEIGIGADEDRKFQLRVDFALCNAGIMFVTPDDLAPSLKVMSDMLYPDSELALRFSLARDDKKDATGKSYFIHDPETVQKLLEANGLKVTRHPDLADPDGRPFTWVDLQAIKPGV